MAASPRPTKAVIFALLLMFLVGCAHAGTEGAPSPVPSAVPDWITKPLPEIGSLSAAGERVVFSTVHGGLGVVDARTGAITWQRPDAAANGVVVGDAIFTANADGQVERFRIADGSLQWHAPICSPTPARRQSRGVQVAGTAGDDLYAYVTCPAPRRRLARIDARSGAVRATSDELGIDGVNAVRDLGHGVVAISAWSGGAELNSQLLLLRRSTLAPFIAVPHSDTTLVGVVGDTAILDDWCCFGRMQAYDPATILRVDLRGVTIAAPIDLRPFPEKLAQQASVFYPALAVTDLWIGIPPLLIDYGNARTLATPVAVLDSLQRPPVFAENGRALVTVLAPDRSVVNELVDLNVRPPRVLWQSAEGSVQPVIFYRPEQSPGIIGLSWGPKRPYVLLRTSDGAAIVGACARQAVMVGDAVVAQCEQRDTEGPGFTSRETRLQRYVFAPGKGTSPSASP